MNTKNENIKSIRAQVRELQAAMNMYVAAEKNEMKVRSNREYNQCEDAKKVALNEMRKQLTIMVGQVGLMMSCSDIIPLHDSLFVTQENIEEHYNHK